MGHERLDGRAVVGRRRAEGPDRSEVSVRSERAVHRYRNEESRRFEHGPSEKEFKLGGRRLMGLSTK